MIAAETLSPRLSDDVVLRQVGTGEYVVKQRKTRSYFRVGETEFFLLSQLNSQRGCDDIRCEFEERFHEPLSAEELRDFLEMIRTQGLLEGSSPTSTTHASEVGEDDEDEFGSPSSQSWLYFRCRLFDPTPVLNRVEPWLRWMWTPGFVAFTAILVAAALVLLVQNRADFASSFQAGLRWETFYIAWLCILAATILHEFAHGLTCKHFGGDVPEIGALMIFGMPSMYCDVTDSWMIASRTQRLWVTLAGSVSDLLVFATATFLWRLTVPASFINYLAWVLATVCGTRVFLNLNPLLRLDGYYLASDWFEIPNLRSESNAYWKENLRHWLWGALPPKPRTRAGILLLYGVSSWVFAIGLLDAIALNLLGVMHAQFGWWGVGVMCLIFGFLSKRVFKGLFKSEVAKMIATRPKRTTAWIAGLAMVALLMIVVPVDRTTSGQFEVRPGLRSEVRSEVPAFVHQVLAVEGDRVMKGQPLLRLQVPDLDSQVTRKQAEIRESEALLRKLKMGPRPEELIEQRQKVRRAIDWRDLAQKDLQRAQRAFDQDLLRMDLEVQQYQTELEFGRVSLANVERLHQLGAISGESRRAEYKRVSLMQAQLAQVNAQKNARLAEGLTEAEAEVARRQKDLADTEAALKLLEAGTRPEDIEAETAHRARLEEELKFLIGQQTCLDVAAPIDGVIATPRMPEKVGVFSDKGGLLCVVEDVRRTCVEIALDEQDIAGIQVGQKIRLKARALPFDCFEATVTRIAPAAADNTGKGQPTLVIVYCEVENEHGRLKSGMTGYARIYRGHQSIAMWLVRQGLSYLRTEFWW